MRVCWDQGHLNRPISAGSKPRRARSPKSRSPMLKLSRRESNRSGRSLLPVTTTYARQQTGLDMRAFYPRMHACAFRLTARASARFGGCCFPSKQNDRQQNNQHITPLNTTLKTSHLIPPHGGELINLILDREQRGRDQSRVARLPVLGPHPAPDLRPRDASQRRLLAAHRLHEQGRLRERLQQHAIAPAAFSGRCRSRSMFQKPSPRRSSPAAPRSPCATPKAS